MKFLMVLSSHDQLENAGRKTGFWLEEFAVSSGTFYRVNKFQRKVIVMVSTGFSAHDGTCEVSDLRVWSEQTGGYLWHK